MGAFLQATPIPDGIDPFLGWLFAMMFGALSSAIAVLWRQSVAESKRKDELIDRLLAQASRAADVTDRSVSLAERQRRQRRVPE